ncbi:MAG: PQQ-binding-like beta-propeller repeat protein [Bacillota bacterium]
MGTQRWIHAALVCLLATQWCNADWPMLARDASRSGTTATEIRPPFERKWYRAFPDEGLMTGIQPIVTDGKCFVGTLKGILHAIDTQTGKDLWTYQAAGPILHTCAAARGKVVFGSGDGRLYAINIADGSLTWTKQTGAAIWNAPAIYEGQVLVGSRDGNLYACDIDQGTVLWTAPTGGPLLCSPAIDPKSKSVYIGSEDMHVYAFDLTSGKQLWRSAKLPGVSFRGYHPVIAPDGSVMITTTPCAPLDTIQDTMLDMVKEVFGDFASWRHKKDENDRLRQANFELMQKPETYQKQLDYLRKRLIDQPAYQTFFVLDPTTGKQKFIAPIVYTESMNGPGAPPLVTPDGKVIVKYSALLRSRYEHYSPFLNVGYLDPHTGHITPIMDQSRTYGWNDSLLLVHDEQSQLCVGGRVLFNTHQDNVNAMNLDTLQGNPGPMCNNVHEVQPGTANSLWAIFLSGKPLPMGWEWFARGTAVYGGGSVIDTSIVIDGDSFYYLPTHEISAGVVLLAYRMQPDGKAATRDPEPKDSLTADDWKKIQTLKWDWDILGMPRLETVLQKGLPDKMPGTRQRPLTEEAKRAVAAITDAQLDEIIWQTPNWTATNDPAHEACQTKLTTAVEELIGTPWQPLLFPAGKHPIEAYRLFVDPTQTLHALAMAYPHLPLATQIQVRAQVAKLSEPGGPLSGPVGQKTYNAHAGTIRSAYDPAPESLLKIQDDILLTDTARIYPLWLWAHVSNDWARLERDWPSLQNLIQYDPPKSEIDCGNGRLAGLIAACRIARHCKDSVTLGTLLPRTRSALRARLEYELAYTEGGLIFPTPTNRSIFGRWRHLTPEIARLLARHAGPIHQHLMDVYVDYHRPTWWLAWNAELLWRNESPFSFPTMALEIFSAKSMILDEKSEELAKVVDLPWCRADESYILKLAMLLNNTAPIVWK